MEIPFTRARLPKRFLAGRRISAGRLERWARLVARTLGTLWTARRKKKTLVVRETAALGERRLVAVVEFEQQRFLVGASPSAITLLAQLPERSPAQTENRCGLGEQV